MGVYLLGKLGNSDTEMCVFWVDDHYEKTTCENFEGLKNGIELNDQILWGNYKDKKAISFDINTSFIDGDGQVIVWYLDGTNGCEFFNFSGQHPLTNETLKSVDQEFVDNYFEGEHSGIDSESNLTFDSSTIEADVLDEVIDEKTPEMNSNLDNVEGDLLRCEKNNTGTICFKNLSKEAVLIKVLRLGNDQRNTVEIHLNNVEKKCLENHQVGTYKYSVFVAATNKLIEQSQYTLKQCDMKLLSFEVPKEIEKPVEVPDEVKKIPKCETEELGDFCFTNNGTKPLHIILSDYSTTSPLSRGFHKLDLAVGENGCYYEMEAGTYNVEYYIETRMNSKYKRVKIVICETGQKVLIY